MKYGAPKKCPVCGDRLQITQMKCGSCRTTVSGEFEQCRFCRLDEKHMEFLLVFLKNRGNIKDVEREMGISYPSVRNNLDSLLRELDLGEQEKSAPEPAAAENNERKGILEMVANGEITAAEAAKLLKKL